MKLSPLASGVLACLFFFLAIPSGRAQAQKRLKDGPWGTLEYFPTYLEAPDHLMELINTPSEKTIWEFPGKSLDQIRLFLAQSGMNDSEIEIIMQPSLQLRTVTGYRLFPPPNLIEELSPASRLMIYRELGKSRKNRHHRFPVIIESGNVVEWFAESGLSHETISLIDKLSYPLGRARAFSDTPLLLKGHYNDREERKILKVLSRTRSLMIRLKLTPGSDIKALKDYWTGGRGGVDLPILGAFAGAPSAHYIDIIHLLPPTPRKYLYKFPSPELGVSGIYPDSFWIALNFFNYLPDDDFDQPSTITQQLESYTEVKPPYRFGDVLLIGENGTSQYFHACVYIADNIVYTKNGRSVLTPFMLMEFDNLLARVTFGKEPTVRAFRVKAF